jgi:hypothetical protein
MRIPLKRAKNVKNGGFSLDPLFLRELADFTLDFIGHLVFEKEIVEIIPYIVMAPRALRALWATLGLLGV